MSFDAWVVGFGASTVIRDLRIVDGNAAYLLLVAVILVDACLLYRFFTTGAGSRFAMPPPASADLKADRQSATLH